MKISIFGLGYVGAVSLACLSRDGHQVVGVDIDRAKLDLIAAGKTPVVEEGMVNLMAAVAAGGNVSVTTDAQQAVHATDVSLICVGTPSAANGSQDQSAVLRLAGEIGHAIAAKAEPHVVVFRSTLVPGTVEDVLRPIIEAASGKKDGEGFFLCFQPEFLREGSSIRDYDKPPFTVVGANHPEPVARLRALFGHLPCKFIETSVRSAEMMKYCCNNFHALKITFANETARLCEALGVDAFEVMDLVCQDTQLNISRAYLKPGFAFGGSCLPKDLRATTHLAKTHDVEIPMLASIMQSNRDHLEVALRKLLATGKRRIGFLGLSFKTGTDDLRESPLVLVAKRLSPADTILAGFIGVLGGCMLVYANPRGRKKAAMVAVLFLAGLLSLPLMFREGSEPLPEGGRAGASPEAAGKPADDDAEKIRLMGLGPLKEENARLAAKDGTAGRAVGLWLRGMKESNKLVVRDHLVRETGADPDSNLYVRDQGDWLMVLSGVKLPLEQISAIVGKLGRDGQAERVYPELGVVEVRVDNDAFVESPIDKLSDRSNPAFYELNKRELDSIDLDRARRAVKRLADAEPKIFREDIVRRLSQLLKDANAADAGLICQALAKWSTPEQGFATTAAADALRRLHGQGAIIGRDMVAFLISRKETSVAPVIDDLWASDRTAWEQLYGELGPAIEPFVLEHLDGGSSILRQSAVRLLGRVGTAKSLPKLQELRGSADAELRVLLERAENSIRQREGQGAR